MPAYGIVNSQPLRYETDEGKTPKKKKRYTFNTKIVDNNNIKKETSGGRENKGKERKKKNTPWESNYHPPRATTEKEKKVTKAEQPGQK